MRLFFLEIFVKLIVIVALHNWVKNNNYDIFLIFSIYGFYFFSLLSGEVTFGNILRCM